MSESTRKFTKEKSQLLSTLLAQAQRKGYIKAETIKSRFARYSPTEDEMEDYFNRFKDSGIDVIYAEPSEDSYADDLFNTEAEISDFKDHTHMK